MGSKLVDVIAALALCAVASQVSACDLPSIPLIPAQIGAQADQLRAQTGVYFNGMRAYSTCIQAELKAAGGDAAPASIKEALVTRNNAAVAEAQAIQKLFQERVGGGQAATPGTQAAVRKLAEGLISGDPDYESMNGAMARATRQQLTNLQRDLVKLGSVIQNVEFRGVDPQGHDIYVLQHDNGASHWLIGLNKDGKINFALVRPEDAR